MKKTFVVLLICTLMTGGFLICQEASRPYSYKLEKGIGECTFTGVSFDQVWSAALKVLMMEKFRIVSSEKQAGVIKAEKRPHFSWNYDLWLQFEQRDDGVYVMASVLPTERQQEDFTVGLANKAAGHKAAHKEEKKLFDKVAELLYEKIEM